MESRQPFAETLKTLMEVQGLSVRELAKKTGRSGSQGSLAHPTIGEMRRGLLSPSPAAIEVVARALGVEPETFAEYRLWRARNLFDPGRDAKSFKRALANYDRLIGSAEGAEMLSHSTKKAVRRRRRQSADGDQVASS